jgi:hypothetical protein
MGARKGGHCNNGAGRSGITRAILRNSPASPHYDQLGLLKPRLQVEHPFDLGQRQTQELQRYNLFYPFGRITIAIWLLSKIKMILRV